MRYPTQQKFRKYVKGYGFLLFVRKFSDKYGKRLMGTATKTGTDAANTASKKSGSKNCRSYGRSDRK